MQKVESLQAVVFILKRSWFCCEKQGNLFKKESLLMTMYLRIPQFAQEKSDYLLL